MNYWWVNQNQTYNQEITGGYMWAPKKKKDGSSNTFYDNMTKVRPGDLVFSFFDTKISYIGVIKSHGYSQPKPDFGAAGEVWEADGWMVNVDYRKIGKVIKPKDHIDVIRPLLPAMYSPLQENGNGNQGVYLTQLPEPLAEKLLDLIGAESSPIVTEGFEHQGESLTDEEAAAKRIEKLIKKDPSITVTEKEALIKARIGQGKFRDDVISLYKKCPFTGISNSKFLRAGHLKPWSKCANNKERLDPLNGIPLTPTADQLVNDGFISFDESGTAIFSPLLNPAEATAMGIDVNNEYKLQKYEGQLSYIKYHRENIYKK